MIRNPFISAVIPVYQEEKTIAEIVLKTKEYVAEVIVIDDGSKDQSSQEAERGGAKVIKLSQNRGVIKAFSEGIKKASGEIIVKLDGDGEHNPEEISRIVEPILAGEADMVIGSREIVPRISERFISWLSNFKVKVTDTGSGFLAARKELLQKMKFQGKCTCGTLVLEAVQKGARIKEVPITVNKIKKKRKIAWFHFWQILYVFKLLIFKR